MFSFILKRMILNDNLDSENVGIKYKLFFDFVIIDKNISFHTLLQYFVRYRLSMYEPYKKMKYSNRV